MYTEWPIYVECRRSPMEDFAKGLDHSRSNMECLVLFQLGSYLPHLRSEHGPLPIDLWVCYEDGHGLG